ncbi:MAG: hypothetical protein AAB874_08315 [Patescibacteria group bacterium]
MHKDILAHIKILCPNISKSQLEQAYRILCDNYPLIPHGKLRPADYSIPVIWADDPRHESLLAVQILMEEICLTQGYYALASTQVGLSIPFIHFHWDNILVQHPEVKPRDNKSVVVLESCGSLPVGNVYLAKYPLHSEISYYYYYEKWSEKVSISPWFDFQTSQTGFQVSQFVHECRHLKGKTAADGHLVDHRRLSTRDWQELIRAFNFSLDKTKIRDIIEECGEDPSPKKLFRVYLQHCKRITHLLVPSSGNNYSSIPLSNL